MTSLRIAFVNEADPIDLSVAIVDGVVQRARKEGGETAVDDMLHYLLWEIIHRQVDRDGPEATRQGLETAGEHAHSALEAMR